jgi:hypothetical protein
VPVDDIISNVAVAVDRVDRTGGATVGEVFVNHPELTAMGPEVTRHYSWIFNVATYPVYYDVRESRCLDTSVPVNLPDAAATIFARHEHVEVKCALMVERNPGMVP